MKLCFRKYENLYNFFIERVERKKSDKDSTRKGRLILQKKYLMRHLDGFTIYAGTKSRTK